MSELACHKSMVASRSEQQVIAAIRASNFDRDVPYAYLQVREGRAVQITNSCVRCGCTPNLLQGSVLMGMALNLPCMKQEHGFLPSAHLDDLCTNPLT